ncbi:MAG: aminoglycoside phosphotransferase family protein [Nitrospinota bacterium]|nr:aminoglycoside phosphotransferase family protein [Nitrospinota bacterium]
MITKRNLIEELLDRAGLSSELFTVTDSAGGGNNRILFLEAQGKRYVAKWYFTHHSDTRDRLRAEYAFLEYAANGGLTSVPKPLACHPEERLALYEYIEGEKLQPGKVTARQIEEAADFILALNSAERRPFAKQLSEASEACFSVDDQIVTIGKRIDRLFTIEATTPENVAALGHAESLKKGLDEIAYRIRGQKGTEPSIPLPENQRCVSPSDFGFHNALVRPNGEICFLDFEYAGWDDPAKMACDFFCQPAIPLDIERFEMFMERSFGFAADPDALARRARQMFPLFQIKWVCIMLNEFLPDSARRRQFGNPEADPEQSKRIQLGKVSKLITSINFKGR